MAKGGDQSVVTRTPPGPVLDLPNCIIIPHQGSASRRTLAAMADLAADNLLAGLVGDRLPAVANPDVYSAR